MSKSKSGIAGAGGMATALLASVCCIGPVVAAAVGIGSVGIVSWIEPIRPLLIVVTFGAIGYGFYGAYRKQPTCQDGSCEVPGSRTTTRMIMWGAAIFAALALTFPYYSAALFGGGEAAAQEVRTTATRDQTAATCSMKITGMTCAGCEHHVKSVLKEVDGVKDASASAETGSATVSYDPTKVGPEVFGPLVTDKTGYKAEICEAPKG